MEPWKRPLYIFQYKQLPKNRNGLTFENECRQTLTYDTFSLQSAYLKNVYHSCLCCISRQVTIGWPKIRCCRDLITTAIMFPVVPDSRRRVKSKRSSYKVLGAKHTNVLVFISSIYLFPFHSDIMELKRMMEKLGQAKTHLELKKMIAEVDTTNSGSFYRETSQSMRTYLVKNQYSDSPRSF